jgi:hypothetical protein
MIAVCLYACNLPLSLVEHEDFWRMVFKLAPWMEGKLISRKTLATSMLDEVYGEVEEQVLQWLQEQDWDKRSKQATTDMVVAAAILDPCLAPLQSYNMATY